MCDNAKEMVLGEFNSELNEVLCLLRQTAKREIKELKRGSGRKIMKSDSPKRLWDDCLELESYIRYNIAHGIYKLDGKVCETIVSKEKSIISQLCESEWFEWVMF